jgi:uncharacterized protein (TIGR02147 family)
MNRKKAVNIYDYTDYRRFLKDYYEEQKARSPVFSYRYFASKAGVNSSGLYKDIVSGRAGITRNMILRFSRAMKLTKRQIEYFEALVFFNEAKTIEEKKLYFERMMSFCDSKAFKVDAGHYEYYSKWYYVAVRELLAIGDFGDDYGLIGRSLEPRITKEQARKAIETLTGLGLVKKNISGHYKAVEKALTTGPDIKGLSIANFQKVMMDLAKDAIDTNPANYRNISTVTFSVSEEAFREISAELDACRKRIVGMIDRCGGEDRVCQLNVQLFHLTRARGEKS